MSDLALISLQFLSLVPHIQRKNTLTLLLCIHTLSVLQLAVVADRSAFLDVSTSDEKLTTRARVNSRNVINEGDVLQLVGSFARAGTVRNIEGLLQKVDSCEDEELERSLQSISLSQDWVGVLESPTSASASECGSLLDKVRKVMFFGASAIIILAMNPKIVAELDISQLFPRPVVLIQEVENVTALLSALASKIKMKVRLTYNATFYDLQKITTLTLWATCGRSSGVRSYSEFDGVICLGNQDKYPSKADPALSWSYFFSGLSILLLLFMLKSKHGRENILNRDSSTERSIQRLTHKIISQLKTRRYKQFGPRDRDNSDTCAVCLDVFFPKQKIRVLPCSHEFHVNCVDPWLRLHQTCPLCKLNIVDQEIKLGAL